MPGCVIIRYRISHAELATTLTTIRFMRVLDFQYKGGPSMQVANFTLTWEFLQELVYATKYLAMKANESLLIFLLLTCIHLKGQSYLPSQLPAAEEELRISNEESISIKNTNYYNMESQSNNGKTILTFPLVSGNEPIPCLNASERINLISHLENFGKIRCWEELTVAGISKAGIICLKENYTPDTATDLSEELKRIKWSNTFLEATNTNRLQWINSTTENLKFAPSIKNPNAALRIRAANAGQILVGINMEKDAGENWWTSKGPDHLGGFIKLSPHYKNWSVVIGDYNLQIGEGLIHGKATFSGIGSEITGICKTGNGIYPHSSMMENGYQSGMAWSMTKKRWNIIFAGSLIHQDGRILIDEKTGRTIFSEDITGYHITLTQISNRNKNTEKDITGFAEWKRNKLRIGFEISLNWSDHFRNASNEPYQLYYTIGKNQHVAGMNYKWQHNNFFLFGQIAKVMNNGSAIVSGVIWNVNNNISASMAFRNFDKDFNAVYAEATKENYKTMNETGLYTALNLKLNNNFSITGFTDNYLNPWISFDNNLPERGSNKGIKINYMEGKSLEMQLLFRNQQWHSNDNTQDYLPATKEESLNQLRWQCTLKPMFGLQLQTRLELKSHQQINKLSAAGYLAFEEISFITMNSKLKTIARISVFDTPDFSLAIYARERDLPYNYDQSINFGKGTSYYLILIYSIMRELDAGLKFSKTSWSNHWVNDEWSNQYGNRKMALSFQINYHIRPR